MSRWWELLARLGQAVLDVVTAELVAVLDEISGTGRKLSISLLILAVALGLAFMGLGLLVVALVLFLSLHMPPSVAALTLGLGIILLAGLVGWWGRSRWRSLETPLDTVRRRWEDQSDWWRLQVLSAPAEEEEEPEDELG